MIKKLLILFAMMTAMTAWDSSATAATVVTQPSGQDDAAKAPIYDRIYLYGFIQGWNINDDTLWLPRVSTGESRIYEGDLFIPHYYFHFRFYGFLGDKESYSIGADPDEKDQDIYFRDIQLIASYSGSRQPYDWVKRRPGEHFL